MNANRLRIGITVAALLALNGGISGLGYHGWYSTETALAASAQEKAQARNSLNQVTAALRSVDTAYASGNAAEAQTKFEEARANWDKIAPVISAREAREQQLLFDSLADSVGTMGDVRSAEAPYIGIKRNIAVDTSFLVFRNERQQEYLGARTSVLGVDRNFDFARDYYVDFHEINPQAPQMVLGMPLLVTTGEARPPSPQEVLVPSGVADYVGVQPGAETIVEFVYSGPGEPIIQRFDGLRLIGTFDMAGPDQGRFEPFWRYNARGQDVLTVRREPQGASATSLPLVVNAALFRDFLSLIVSELARRGGTSARLPARDQLIVRAGSIADVPATEAAVAQLLQQRGLERRCDVQGPGSFCLRLPERNNFQSALQEQNKVGSGGGFFVGLLLILVTAGAAGL